MSAREESNVSFVESRAAQGTARRSCLEEERGHGHPRLVLECKWLYLYRRDQRTLVRLRAGIPTASGNRQWGRRASFDSESVSLVSCSSASTSVYSRAAANDARHSSKCRGATGVPGEYTGGDTSCLSAAYFASCRTSTTLFFVASLFSESTPSCASRMQHSSMAIARHETACDQGSLVQNPCTISQGKSACRRVGTEDPAVSALVAV